MSSAEDYQNPDELRPAKRMRLEGSLTVTDRVQEEIMDQDDWDDVYGGPDHETGMKTPVIGESANTQLPSGGSHLSDLARPVPFTDDQMQDVPATDSSVTASDVTTLEVESRREDLVAPGPAVEGMDAQSANVLAETTAIETGKAAQTAPVDTLSARFAHVHVMTDLEQQTTDAKAHDDPDEATASTKARSAVDPEFAAAAEAQRGKANAEWQFDSSDAESSSDSDSSDSDSSDDSDDSSEGGYELLDPATAARMLMSGDGDDDDGDNKGKGGAASHPRTTNEMTEVAVPKPNITITPDMKITLLGTVEQTVEAMALIKGATPGEYQVLESGSVLCNENRDVVGAVADIFGRVQEPMYSIAFSNSTELEEAGITMGTKIYYVDDHSTFVFTQPLRNLKGTDASNIHDEEVGEDEMEFSDDEKEAEYKRQKKMAKKAGRGGLSRGAFNAMDGGHAGGSGYSNAPSHNQGGNDAPSQSYGGGMSYDDNDEPMEEFYQPLKRPENLSQMMAGGVPPSQSQHSFERGRGRGRGDRGRGRGDRGAGRGSHGHQDGRGGARARITHPREQRGNARTFPDSFNYSTITRGRQSSQVRSFPPRGASQNTSTQIPGQNHPRQDQVSQQPQSYQFNGYTFQYGSQYPATAPQGYPPPQNFPPAQQQPPQGFSGQMPAGMYVNPAFFQQQQQHQQAQQAGYGAWAPPAPQQQQQHGQQYQPPPPPAAQPPADLAEILRSLTGRQG